MLPACPAEEIPGQVCVVGENSKGVLFSGAEMLQLRFGFRITFLSKVYPIFYHTLFKIMIGTNFFSILKMFLFI